MPYRCDLSPGQQIYLDNQGSQTIITVASGSAGQQQQSSSRLQTGPWQDVPQIARVGGGVIIRCVSTQGVFTFQVQGNQVSTVTGALDWATAQDVPVQLVDHLPGQAMPPMQPMAPMQPMTPMQPMQMGSMKMSANPMEMRMGDMEMRMGQEPAKAAAKSRFCTQCGTQVNPDDRFCSSCGHQLT